MGSLVAPPAAAAAAVAGLDMGSLAAADSFDMRSSVAEDSCMGSMAAGVARVADSVADNILDTAAGHIGMAAVHNFGVGPASVDYMELARFDDWILPKVDNIFRDLHI